MYLAQVHPHLTGFVQGNITNAEDCSPRDEGQSSNPASPGTPCSISMEYELVLLFHWSFE